MSDIRQTVVSLVTARLAAALSWLRQVAGRDPRPAGPEQAKAKRGGCGCNCGCDGQRAEAGG